MKKIILLSIILIVGCSTEPKDVYGCTNQTACNFNSSATIFDDSCIYAGEIYDCDGNCLFDDNSDDICDQLQGTINDIDGNTYKTVKIGEQV